MLKHTLVSYINKYFINLIYSIAFEMHYKLCNHFSVVLCPAY